MKKVIFSIAAVMAGVTALAQAPQPTPTITRTAVTAPGWNPMATVGGNYSDIDQIAVGNDAIVTQQGTSNASFISQTGANAGIPNTIDVLQWGNITGLSGQLNYSTITQDGEGNGYILAQQGDNNENSGLQVGKNNDALVKQGDDTAQQAAGNLAIVDQDGQLNEAEIQQRYDNSTARIIQRNNQLSGVRNISYQDQVADPNNSAGHLALGSQDGDGNELRQFQEGPSTGFGNYADIKQGDLTTKATGAFAQQIQIGESNQAFAEQFLFNDDSYQYQDGTGNLAVVKQNTGGISTGGNNLVEQYQDGDDNEARSDQNGNDNDAFQEQYGNDNVSTVMQRYGQLGGNEALSMQRGSLNDSEINQQAHNNKATVDQMGQGHMSVVNQNNPITGAQAAVAGNNTATVIQRNANASLTLNVQRAAASSRAGR